MRKAYSSSSCSSSTIGLRSVEAQPISICVPGEGGEPGKAAKTSEPDISSRSSSVHSSGARKLAATSLRVRVVHDVASVLEFVDQRLDPGPLPGQHRAGFLIHQRFEGAGKKDSPCVPLSMFGTCHNEERGTGGFGRSLRAVRAVCYGRARAGSEDVVGAAEQWLMGRHRVEAGRP